MNNITNYTANSEVSTLLVLRHRTNAVGVVQAVNSLGNLIDVQPERMGVDRFIRIDTAERSFSDFYWDFYQQLKEPSEYSFFKVREFEAYETAKGLQEYIYDSSDVERQELQEYEVSIEAVENARNTASVNLEISMVKKGQSDDIYIKGNCSQYRYQIEDIPWEKMAELGLDQEKLEEIGVMDVVLKGYKTPMLIPILFNDGEAVRTVDARLQLRIDDEGELIINVHRVREEVDFSNEFKGHQFTREDEFNLLNSGNMGRVVDLIDSVTGEIIPSLISLDRLTNELISLRMEFVRICNLICGVRLDSEQKQILREGKALFVENMISKKGSLFSATFQFNADRQWVEFLFADKLRNFRFSKVNDAAPEVPSHFRGVKLRRWQMDKLKAGETAYITGLESKKGKLYQGYISYDIAIGRIVFSFKNEKKKLGGV